jgi:hypothetical protein
MGAAREQHEQAAEVNTRQKAASSRPVDGRVVEAESPDVRCLLRCLLTLHKHRQQTLGARLNATQRQITSECANSGQGKAGWRMPSIP